MKRAILIGSLLASFLCAFSARAEEPEDACAAERGAAIDYSVGRDCFVTLTIIDHEGGVVRELITAKTHAAGDHQVFWDGKDNYGRPLGAGEYSWRILTHDGITTEYVTSIGNSGTPPWRTFGTTGGWGGNQGNPTAVAADHTGVYLSWNGTEGPYSILKRTHEGTSGLWGIETVVFGGAMALASDRESVYAVTSPNEHYLLKINRDNGHKFLSVALSLTKPEEETEPLGSDDSLPFNFRRSDQRGFVWGLAANTSRVYLSNAWNNVIEVFDATDLTPLPSENIAMHRPRGLVLDGLGNLLVVTDGQVLSIGLASGAVAPLITSGLVAPFAISRAPADGNLYVTDLGTSHQVKKFSAQGELLAAFGTPGGGSDFVSGGEFQSQDFRYPSGIAALPDGSFWVAEDSIPKRMAHFSANGELLFEGFGSVNGGNLTAPNPNDPEEVFSTMWGAFTGRVNYDEGTSAMSRILPVRWGAEGPGILESINLGYSPDKLIAREGLTYMWTGTTLFVVEADHLRPVMFFIPGLEEEGTFADIAREQGIERRGWQTEVVMWVDVNGDASAQIEEFRIVPLPEAAHGPQYFGAHGMDEHFNLFASYGYTWPPRDFNSAGVPLYEAEDLVNVPGFDAQRDFHLFGESPTRDSLGNYYQTVNVANESLPFGDGWWSSRSSESFVRSFTPDWKLRWQIGRKAVTVAAPGEMYFPFRIYGEIGKCMLASDAEGFIHVIYREGAYVQAILQDLKSPELRLDYDNLNVENFSGSVMEHPVTGKKYLYISSDQASLVLLINGLESIEFSEPQSFTLAE